MFFKLIKLHLLVSELYICQNAQCNDKNYIPLFYIVFINLQMYTVTVT